MDKSRFSFALAAALAAGILTAGCAHNSSTASTTGATAPDDQKRSATESRSNREPVVPLNQQGGY